MERYPVKYGLILHVRLPHPLKLERAGMIVGPRPDDPTAPRACMKVRESVVSSTIFFPHPPELVYKRRSRGKSEGERA